jgi:hypothetical protein
MIAELFTECKKKAICIDPLSCTDTVYEILFDVKKPVPQNVVSYS